jgi:uncharacterized protein YkwD
MRERETRNGGPHPRRPVRATSRTRTLLLPAAIGVALLALTLHTRSGTAAPAKRSSVRLNAFERELLAAINVTRRQHHLDPLVVDLHLERAARFHVDTMLGTDTFAHGDFGARMERFRVKGHVAGENLAWGAGYAASPTMMVTEWLHSPEHRENLLLPAFRRIGVGSEKGAFAGQGDATVVTVDFAGR